MIVGVRLLVGATKNVGAESFFVYVCVLFFRATPLLGSRQHTKQARLFLFLYFLLYKKEKSEGRATGAAAVRFFQIFSRFIFN